MASFRRKGATAIVVSGDYAFVGTCFDVGLDVLNISQPSNPKVVGRCDINGWFNWGPDVVTSGQLAYVASHPGLAVVDISHPADPRLLGTFDYDYRSNLVVICVAARGHFACAMVSNYAGTVHGLQVFDVSNPANPEPVGWCATHGSGRRLVISGNYAYVAEEDGLEVVDISNPAVPQSVGWCGVEAAILDVAVLGTNTYLAQGYAGLQVIDVSNPAHPQAVGRCVTGVDARNLALSDKHAFVIGYEQLAVISLSNPTQPQLVGKSDRLGPMASGIAVSDHYAYVTHGDPGGPGATPSGVEVIDISNPSSPKVLRLPLTVAPIFTAWLEATFPARAEKVLHRIRAIRGGKLNDSRFGLHMRGEGISPIRSPACSMSTAAKQGC